MNANTESLSHSQEGSNPQTDFHESELVSSPTLSQTKTEVEETEETGEIEKTEETEKTDWEISQDSDSQSEINSEPDSLPEAVSTLPPVEEAVDVNVPSKDDTKEEQPAKVDIEKEELAAQIEKLSDEIKRLSDEIEKLPDENAKLRENQKSISDENAKLRETQQSMEERLSRLETTMNSSQTSGFDFQPIVNEILRKDEISREEDTQEQEKYSTQAQNWKSAIRLLDQRTLAAISECNERIKVCSQLMEKFKETDDLYQNLINRYEGLELIQRMLERLKEPLSTLKTDTIASSELERLQEQDLLELVRSQTDEKQAKLILEKKLKQVGDTRYQSIREWRDRSENLHKQWLRFIEKKLLPILDGLEEGKKYSQSLIDELKERYGDRDKQLSDWLQTYDDLKDILIEVLKALNVIPMKVEINQPVDYNCHEPIGTEQDSNLRHESVKEVTRNGYEYELSGQKFLLRSAQVIIVKNQ